MIDKFMKQLAKEMEIADGFETQMPGVFAIPLDEDITIMVTSLPVGFTVSCVFGECPKTKTGEFYTHALRANLLGKGTDGAVLGLDEEGKRLKLTLDVDYSVDYNEFHDMIEDFMNSVDFWAEEAQSYVSEQG